MQQCQPNRAGAGAGPLPSRQISVCAGLRHRALLLIGDRGGGRLRPALARRVLDRILAPAAQVEGVDMHLADPRLFDAAAEAEGFILLLPPLGNLSNPFYSVHPRRNDRFLAAHVRLKTLFPEVDFAQFDFTGHALGSLAAACPRRYAEVRRGLHVAWVARMQLLIGRLPARGVLLDLPAPAWLQRPSIPGEGRRRLLIDPDDRGTGGDALRAALSGLHL